MASCNDKHLDHRNGDDAPGVGSRSASRHRKRHHTLGEGGGRSSSALAHSREDAHARSPPYSREQEGTHSGESVDESRYRRFNHPIFNPRSRTAEHLFPSKTGRRSARAPRRWRRQSPSRSRRRPRGENRPTTSGRGPTKDRTGGEFRRRKRRNLSGKPPFEAGFPGTRLHVRIGRESFGVGRS